MNLKSRILRIAFALVLAAAVAMQIPSRTGVAVADDSYGGSGGGGGRTLIQATVFGLVGYGIYATVTGQGAPGEVTTDSQPGEDASPPPTQGDPIWDVCNKTNDLKQFATTSESAGYKETLRKSGVQYTAFVPTNNAFGALDPQVLQDLMKEENKVKFAEIIGFHVVQGEFKIEALKTEAAKSTEGFKATTITGKILTITNDGGLKVNGTPMVESDIPATNGVIHPIAAVLMPSE